MRLATLAGVAPAMKTVGKDGPHPIDFFNDQHFSGTGSTASGCSSSTRDKIQAVINHPADYYVIIHTTAFTEGAIRGQLG